MESSLIVYDATRKPSLLDESWGSGAFSMWLRGRSDGMLGALSWKEVFQWLKQRREDHGPIKELQFWGHGHPGEAYINGKSIRDVIGHLDWKELMDKNGLWWFRTCSTFHGEEGKKLAEQFSALLGCRVAGHTHKIGFPTHSGLHSILPFEKANWKDNEGKKKNGKIKGSLCLRTRTIPFWRNTIPKGW